MKLIEFIKTAYARFTSPTPTFWKSVQRKFGRLAAMFIALGALYEAQDAGTLPIWILDWITYAGIVCGAVVIVAQFACEDSTDEK